MIEPTTKCEICGGPALRDEDQKTFDCPPPPSDKLCPKCRKAVRDASAQQSKLKQL